MNISRMKMSFVFFLLKQRGPGFIFISLASKVTKAACKITSKLNVGGFIASQHISRTELFVTLSNAMHVRAEKDSRQLPGLQDLNSNDTDHLHFSMTYHKLYKEFRGVCELKFIRKWIKYYNHASPNTVRLTLCPY